LIDEEKEREKDLILIIKGKSPKKRNIFIGNSKVAESIELL